MKKLMEFILLLLLYLLFLPILVMALIIVSYKQIAISKKFDVSATAMDILQGRWYMHLFNIREDQVTIELMKHLPTGSHYGQLFFALPMLIVHRLTGYTPTLAKVPEASQVSILSLIPWRTTVFDQHIKSQLDGVTQIVSMGAGYDSKGMNSIKDSPITLFELDMPKIQGLKIDALKKATLYDNKIVYVPVDFNNESWSDKLVEAGYLVLILQI